ncbi:DUF4166 domain-containing protein [Marimonas lutisalis]|uniref:DUF4166 domain-containing protein n=1 Tax=Marimonas lutisalis TaxID=2545756 RepID=UPI001375A908|nr:DUF4166 domain-containing protein [Marimonas lutisalis]
MSGDPFLKAIEYHGLSVAPALLEFHGGTGEKRYHGRCTIMRGRGPLIRLALWLGRFPPAAQDQSIRLAMHIGPGESRWLRGFGGHPTASTLRFDSDRGEVIERFGALRVAMRPTVCDDTLHFSITRLWVMGVRLPRILLPRSATHERAGENGRVHFDVSARAPVLGMLIRYVGWLDPVPKEK